MEQVFICFMVVAEVVCQLAQPHEYRGDLVWDVDIPGLTSPIVAEPFKPIPPERWTAPLILPGAMAPR